MERILHDKTKLSLPFLVISGLLVLCGLYLVSLYSFLLFHAIVEVFSIAVGLAIFMLAWNARPVLESHHLLFLGIAYFYIAGIDLLHTLAYKGMGVFPGYSANLPTQLWIPDQGDGRRSSERRLGELHH